MSCYLCATAHVGLDWIGVMDWWIYLVHMNLSLKMMVKLTLYDDEDGHGLVCTYAHMNTLGLSSDGIKQLFEMIELTHIYV